MTLFIANDASHPFKVIEELHTDQFSQIDPEVVQVFIDGLTNFFKWNESALIQ